MKKLVFVLLLWTFGIRGDTEMETSNLPASKPIAFTTQDDESPTPSTKATTEITTSTSQNSVTLLEQIKPQKIPLNNKFRSAASGVKSDSVIVLDNKTIFVQNFYFDGTTASASTDDVQFFVGKGNKPSSVGTAVPTGELDEGSLRSYAGQNVTLKLPGDLMVSDINWLAVWSTSQERSLGFVFVNKMSPYPPQVLGLEDMVKSNPIVIVNKKTFFVPNLRYDGRHGTAYFVVGQGSEPDFSNFKMVDSLHPYGGENVYVRLPKGTTTDDIDYLGVYSEDKGLNLGHVSVKGVADIPDSNYGFEEKTRDGQIIMRIPKCCPIYSVLTSKGCRYNDSLEFQPAFDVFEHNETHVNNESISLNDIRFEPYTFSMSCASGKYPLDEDHETFALLQNGSLILKGTASTGVLSQGEFCLETLDDDTNSMQILVCAPTVKINHAMFHAYVTLIVISTLCFAGAVILYYFILQCKDIHKKCFIGYSLSMCATFFFLTIAQIAYLDNNNGCITLGFFFQFAMICSFVWLAILCFDIALLVIYFDDDNTDGKRFKWYCAIAFLVPTLSVIISLCRNLVPDVPDSFFKPQYGRNSCYFDERDQRRVFFYVPISICVCVSLMCLGYAKYKIVQTDRKFPNDYFWIGNGRSYKFMFRRYFIIFVTMLLWLVEAVISLFTKAHTGILMAIDIIEAVQGIVILLLFVLNREAKFYIMEKMQSQKKKNMKRFTEEDLTEMAPINGGSKISSS